MQWFLYLSYIIASFSFYIPTTVEVMKTQQKKNKIKKNPMKLKETYFKLHMF